MMMMETPRVFHIQKIVYINDHNIFMVYWWGRYSYFNNEKIKIIDVEIMNYTFGSSVSFRSRVRSKILVITNIH